MKFKLADLVGSGRSESEIKQEAQTIVEKPWMGLCDNHASCKSAPLTRQLLSVKLRLKGLKLKHEIKICKECYEYHGWSSMWYTNWDVIDQREKEDKETNYGGI